MPESDPFELVWMHKDDEPSPYKTVQRFGVSTHEELGWSQVSKSEAKKHGFALPSDLAAKTTTAQEG